MGKIQFEIKRKPDPKTGSGFVIFLKICNNMFRGREDLFGLTFAFKGVFHILLVWFFSKQSIIISTCKESVFLCVLFATAKSG